MERYYEIMTKSQFVLYNFKMIYIKLHCDAENSYLVNKRNIHLFLKYCIFLNFSL